MLLEQITLTPEQALEQLKELTSPNYKHDKEAQHIDGDVIIYQLLLGLGHTEVAGQYKTMMREWWYA